MRGHPGMAQVPGCRVLEVADQDWVRLTQSQFQPIPISERLWIVPSWHASPDPSAIAIVLDPGLAFAPAATRRPDCACAGSIAMCQGGETVLDTAAAQVY